MRTSSSSRKAATALQAMTRRPSLTCTARSSFPWVRGGMWCTDCAAHDLHRGAAQSGFPGICSRKVWDCARPACKGPHLRHEPRGLPPVSQCSYVTAASHAAQLRQAPGWHRSLGRSRTTAPTMHQEQATSQSGAAGGSPTNTRLAHQQLCQHGQVRRQALWCTDSGCPQGCTRLALLQSAPCAGAGGLPTLVWMAGASLRARVKQLQKRAWASSAWHAACGQLVCALLEALLQTGAPALKHLQTCCDSVRDVQPEVPRLKP